jgi:hypothetical protein
VAVFVTLSGDAEELEAARDIFAAIPAQGKVLHKPVTGIHGSSTLIADKNARGHKSNWAAVSKFLDAVTQ